MLDWIPSFAYATATGGSNTSTCALSIPTRYHRPIEPTLGGSAKSATGVPAAYVVRREAVLEFTLRFKESEWSGVRKMLAFGQAHPNSLTFKPSQTATYSYAVYLESPLMGEEIAPEREGDYAEVFTVPIRVRALSGTPFALEWFNP